MMKTRRRSILFFLACAIPGWPASATPPDIINVRDEVFGITDDSILLLRATHDNLGVYNAEHRDIVLVAIDRKTGRETLRPVYRVHVRPSEGADQPARAAAERLPGSVDPFEVLRERNGIALGASGWRSGGSASLKGDTLSIAYEDGAVFQVKAAALLRHMTSSLDGLADNIEDYDRLAPVSVQDLLAGHAYDIASCEFLEPIHSVGLHGTAPARLLRMTCQEDGQTASILVSVGQ